MHATRTLHAQHTKEVEVQRESALADNYELRMELLRWRKKASIFRLKLASAEEDSRMSRENQAVLHAQLHAVAALHQAQQAELRGLREQLEQAKGAVQAQREDVLTHQVGDSSGMELAKGVLGGHRAGGERGVGG